MSTNTTAATATKNTVYVVTGANRGIGLALVKALLARPATTVVATVRSDAAAETLKSEMTTTPTTSAGLALGDSSVLHVAQLDFSTAPAPSLVRDRISAFVPRVDVLVLNAALIPPLCPSLDTAADDLRCSFETNVIAPLGVFQGLWPLMQRGRKREREQREREQQEQEEQIAEDHRPPPPKVFSITSTVGSISVGIPEAPGGAYGPGKAALNWVSRSLHFQHADDGLVSVALHPGWVQTRAGDYAASEWGYAPGPPDTVEESVRGMLEVMDGATRERWSGEFVTHRGMAVPW